MFSLAAVSGICGLLYLAERLLGGTLHPWAQIVDQALLVYLALRVAGSTEDE